MKTSILFGVVVGFVFNSNSTFAYDGRPDSIEARLFARTRYAQEQMLRNCQECSFADAPSADPVCRSQYDRVFSKNVVNIHVAFGYIDHSENPGGGLYFGVRLEPNESVDSAAREGLIRQMTLQCQGAVGACGFERDDVDQELLTKRVQYKGHETLVKIRLTDSAATPSYIVNTGSGKGRQSIATYRAELNFFGSLGSSDLTIYDGHARGGGGPDFNPPIRLPDGHPNYNGYYRVKKPGLKKLLSTLQSARTKPALLAILACKTDELFREPILKAAPGIGLITTSDLVYFENGFSATYIIIDSFLKKECGETFEKSLSSFKTVNGARFPMRNFVNGRR